MNDPQSNSGWLPCWFDYAAFLIVVVSAIGEYILQKVLDTSPITTTGFCCHKISLAKVGYSRDMCPKQPKKVSHYVKILEKNCLKIKFFK